MPVLPNAMRHSASSRSCSKLWEAETRSRSCHSRAKSVTHSSPVRAARSAAIRRASCSSAQRTARGRFVSCRSAAPSIARCTPLTPLTAAGPVPKRMISSSSRSSGSAIICRFSSCMNVPSFFAATRKRAQIVPGRTVCTHTHRFPCSPEMSEKDFSSGSILRRRRKVNERMINFSRRRRSLS